MSDSNEFFMWVDGKKTDAPLHWEILNRVKPDRGPVVERARKDGLSEEAINELYPKENFRPE